jgi:hypothetical protein
MARNKTTDVSRGKRKGQGTHKDKRKIEKQKYWKGSVIPTFA